MLPAALIKQITAKAHERKKSGESADSTIEMREAARRAAAQKMMAAMKSDDSDGFLQALSELKTIDED